jgi:hypothetical protein
MTESVRSAVTCFRCGKGLLGPGIRVWPPRGVLPWVPMPESTLMCVECGGNGANVLTSEEYLQVTEPDTLFSGPEPAPSRPDSPAPALPYPDAVTGRTGGHSGSDTSAERARGEATSGAATRRQRLVLYLLRQANTQGLTWRELSASTGQHHGQASGALSNLHKMGRIARLVKRRGRCHVYVLPEYVNDRPTEPHGGRPTASLADAWDEGYGAGLSRTYGEHIENPYRKDDHG